jgi:hypothetical protein
MALALLRGRHVSTAHDGKFRSMEWPSIIMTVELSLMKLCWLFSYAIEKGLGCKGSTEGLTHTVRQQIYEEGFLFLILEEKKCDSDTK